jgi:hypothetical protein
MQRNAHKRVKGADRFWWHGQAIGARLRLLSPLAVTVLPIPFARRAAATACAAVQSTAPLFRRW